MGALVQDRLTERLVETHVVGAALLKAAKGGLASPSLSLSIPFALPSFTLASVRPPLSYKNPGDSADDRGK